jgi:anti-sigma factor RsiW
VAELSGQSAHCERARLWAALEVDGELSELERKLLLAHTQHCAACAHDLEQFHAAAEVLRSAEPEAPLRAFVVPRRAPRVRRPTGIPRLAAGLAVLVAAAAGLGVLTGTLTGDERSSRPVSIDVALLTKNGDREFRDMRRPDLQPPRERFNPPGRLAAV